MKITFAAVADYASISEGGKLNVMGIFDRITASSFPVRHPFMVFAFRIRAEWEDSNREPRLVIQLEDEDGQKAFTLEGALKASVVEPGMFVHTNQIIALRDVVFRKPGQYRFRVQIDGREPAEYPLQVVQAGPSA